MQQIDLKNKRAKDLNRHLTREYTQVANKRLKRCSTSHAIREMQVKATARYHHTPTRTAKLQDTATTKCWGGRGTWELSFAEKYKLVWPL